MTTTNTIFVNVRIDVKVSWRTALKMMVMGRYPAAILARAVAERIRNEK